MRIGIIGGTFNPIHNGHLIMSQYIKESLKLEKIIFMPAGNPPHKKNFNVVESKHRKMMVKKAIKTNPGFEMSSIEIDKDKLSYTVDTLRKLKEDKFSEDELFFIVGGDSLMDFHTWKDYKKIMEYANIVVADRYGYEGRDLNNAIKNLSKVKNSKIINIRCPIIEISSTEIRQRVELEQSIKYLVPEIIEEYIKDKELYIG